MAKIFPTIEVVKRSRQKPTEGELFLLEYLEAEFDQDAEVYSQPYFNGDRPDIVILHKDKGIIIIEVKDWALGHYYLEDNNDWHLKLNKARLRSPFSQAFGYKKNMFDIHINGLLEKKIRNSNFYKVISCFVYFHKATKQSLADFYAPQIQHYNDEIKSNLDGRANGSVPHEKYEKKDIYLNSKRRKFERDLGKHSLTKDQFKKIKFPFDKASPIFPSSVSEEFLRYLQPPFHSLNEGKVIKYEKKQLALIASNDNDRTKIKGVAGSGKTTVLAARAVNAHKRHEDRVLILTFNLTLRMYIKDKINEVREDFPWGVFDIINYHKFINQSLNGLGLAFDIPDEIKNNSDLRNDYIDRHYYSNEEVFSGCKIENAYQTILIDEIQDYKPEWIKIIRRYFLAENGELVLFGDEKQNIYEREIESDKTTKTVQGFGRWQQLTKCFRNSEDSHILKLASDFQTAYFSGTYESDFEENIQQSLTGIGINKCLIYDPSDVRALVDYVFRTARGENIHPNDITILSSKISILRELDFLIRKDDDFNERTLTTFESKEAYTSEAFIENVQKIRANKKYGFNLNSGVVKLSTIHSFKGYESPTVFLIVDEHDNEELVYVGITRAMINLVVFVQDNSKYEPFFSRRLEKASLDPNAIKNKTADCSTL